MANGKNYSIREEVLDQYLSSGKWYSGRQLVDFCNRELEDRGESLIRSRTTLQNDILEIENKYRIIIAKKRKGRVIYYKYEDSGFSIFNRELTMDDRNLISQGMELLSRFEGMPQFEWVDEMLARFNISLYGNTNRRPAIGFEDSSNNVGMQFFTPLLRAINEKTTLDITYKPFGKDIAKVYTVSPYYLKQYNNRWTLIAKTMGYDGFTNLPLDRIVEFKNAGKQYEETDVDFTDYFWDSIGPTVTDECEMVEIWMNKRQLDYVKTKPLHGSHRVLFEDEKGGIVQYKLKLNYELEQEILSFGENATVIHPAKLRDKIQSRIKASLQNYESVQEQ